MSQVNINSFDVGVHKVAEPYDVTLEVLENPMFGGRSYQLHAEGKMWLSVRPEGQKLDEFDIGGWVFEREEYPMVSSIYLPPDIVAYDDSEFAEMLLHNRLPEGDIYAVLMNGLITPIGIYDPNDNIQLGYPFYLNKSAFLQVLQDNDCTIFWHPKSSTHVDYNFAVIAYMDEKGDYLLHQPGGTGKYVLDKFDRECKMSIKSFVDSIESTAIIEHDGTFGGTYINGYKSNLGVYTMDSGNSFGYFPIQSNQFTKVLKNTKSYVLWYNK